MIIIKTKICEKNTYTIIKPFSFNLSVIFLFILMAGWICTYEELGKVIKVFLNSTLDERIWNTIKKEEISTIKNWTCSSKVVYVSM